MSPAIVTTCRLNQVLDYVVEQLALMVKAKSGLNLVTVSPTVKRIYRLGDMTGLGKPLVAVQLLGWTVDPQCAMRYEGVMRWAAHCHVDAGQGDDEQRLLDLVTDVLRALAADVTLGGQVTYNFPVEFVPQVDQSGQTGYGAADLTYEARYTWDAATP